MLQNITETLKCGPQRVSKYASCLLYLFRATHSPSIVSLLPCASYPLIQWRSWKWCWTYHKGQLVGLLDRESYGLLLRSRMGIIMKGWEFSKECWVKYMSLMKLLWALYSLFAVFNGPLDILNEHNQGPIC